MTEPTVTIAASGLSAALLAWIGVDAHAVFWGFSGSTLTLVMTDAPMSRGRAVVTVVVCALSGAALGQYAAELFASSSRAGLIALALVFGAGAQVLVPAIINRFARGISGVKS